MSVSNPRTHFVDSRSGCKTQKHPSESLLENMAFYYKNMKTIQPTHLLKKQKGLPHFCDNPYKI